MWNIMCSEFYKVRKSKVTWVTLFVFLTMAVIEIAAVAYAKMKSKDWEMLLESDGITVFSRNYTGTLYCLLVALFVGGIVTSEYTTGTVKQVVSRGMSRAQIVIAQYVALSVAITIITMIPLIVLMLVYTFSWQFGSITLGRFLLLLVGRIVVIWNYAAISMLIGHITRSGGLSIGINMIILLIGSMAVTVVSALMKWETLPDYWLLNMQSEALDYTSGVGLECKYILLLLLLGVVCTGLSVLVFQKRDVG